MHNLFPRVMRKVSIGKEEGVGRMLEKEPNRKMVEDDFQKENKAEKAGGVFVNPEFQSIGGKIRIGREREHLTQAELAQKLSVTRQAVSNWERDKTLPDIYMIREIAEIFGLTLDEFMEGAKKPSVTMPKTPSYLLAGTCAAILFQLVAGGMAQSLSMEMMAELIVMDIIVGIFIQLFLHLYFSNAIKSNNFSMIAGYDSRVEYRVEEVKKVLVQIDCHVGCVSFGTVFLMGSCLLLEEPVSEMVAIGLIFFYCVDLMVMLLLINYRSLEKTLVKEQDQKVAKAGYVSLFWFVAWMTLFLLLSFLRFELRQIVNNTPQAFGYIGWLALFLAITLIGLFYEQWRAKKEVERKGSYRPGKCLLACTVLSAAVTAGMILA